MRSRITSNTRADKAGGVLRRTSAARFCFLVWDYWKKNGRHDLPWRNTKNPYRILVSEIMLQQTQVSRVIPKYEEFLKRFPTVRALAKAPLADVLKIWSGLGYNRRGKYVHDAAKEIVAKHGAKVPRDFGALRSLPGIGDYTASAVRVFAFNEPDTFIETNIRTAFIHYFSRGRSSVSDAAMMPIVKRVTQRQDPRTWHWALMDYGAFLKKSGVRNNSRSKHYTKQSKFEGSLRQIRGAILRELHKEPSSLKNLSFEKERIENALVSLSRDGLIVKVHPRRNGLGPKKGKWRIA